MLHQVIPSILLILGYVSAAAAAEPECAEFVDLTILDPIASSSPPRPEALKKFSGLYQVTDEKNDDKPVYRNEDDTNLCMFTVRDEAQLDWVALGDCKSKAVEYKFATGDAPDTCFSPDMQTAPFSALDGTSTVVESGENVAEMESVVRGADCSECREILAGNLKGNYTLIDKHSPHCHSDTDMCVYENKGTKVTVCFEKDDAAGTDTMPHDETCG